MIQKVNQIEVFFDGDCPLCKREISWVRSRARDGQILFTDISHPDFDAEAATGKTYYELMARLHARTADGEWITGIEVTRRMFEAIGYGWLVWPTRWPILRQLSDWSYDWFARNRLRLTGRGPLAECMECRVGDKASHGST